MKIGSRNIITIILMFFLTASVLIFGGQIPQASALSSGAVLTGVITDRGVDTDGDDTYNYLEIGVEVNVSEAGNYMVNAYGLFDSDYEYIDVSDSQKDLSLDVGVQVVYLHLDGSTIYASGLNPTNVSGISLFDEGYEVLGDLHNVPLSRMYYYTEFDTPGAVLTGVITDRGVDTDGNGFFEYLEIGVEVSVTELGFYHLEVSGLHDPYFNWIDVWNYTEAYLDVGLVYLNISFVGVKIYVSGFNASHVSSIALRDEELNNIGSLSDIPLSRMYYYTEFDTPGAVLTGVITDRGVDTDGDDTYNYLEIGVEVNVSEAGNYMVNAYGLFDSDYEYIDVSDSQKDLSLDVGVQVVYLHLDGSTIYASGLNPTNVSGISLFDEDYEAIGDLYNIRLSRMYYYTEFDIPVPLTVGVKVGDWAKYTVTATWQSTDPNATEPPQFKELKNVEWLKFEVQNVFNTHIAISGTYHFVNGTDQILPPISIDIATQFFAFVIPSNFSEGDMIPGFLPIDGTTLRDYAGVGRNVNYINFSTSTFGMNMTQVMYWDKSTGVLCEMLQETSTLTDSCVTIISTGFEIIETNMWFPIPQMTMELSSETVIRGDPVTVSSMIKDLAGNPIEGANVTVYIDDKAVDLTDLGGGYYEVDVDTSDVVEGTYEITVSVYKEGFEPIDLSETLTVETRILHVTIQISTDTVTQGGIITVSATVKDLAENSIEGATVFATLGHKTITLSDKGSGNYEGNIDTFDISDGTYLITVTAEKELCESAEDVITLTVKAAVPWMLIGGIIAIAGVIVSMILYLVRRRRTKLAK